MPGRSSPSPSSTASRSPARAARLRTDAFFAGRPGARPAAGEVLEGIVTAARLSADERRVRHLGYLLAEVAYSTDVDAELVGRALRLAEHAELAAAGDPGRGGPAGPGADAHGRLEVEPAGWNAWARPRGRRRPAAQRPARPAGRDPAPGGAALPRLRAADLRLTRRGVLVHRLLVLDVLRDDAVAAALADLGLPRS